MAYTFSYHFDNEEKSTQVYSVPDMLSFDLASSVFETEHSNRDLEWATQSKKVASLVSFSDQHLQPSEYVPQFVLDDYASQHLLVTALKSFKETHLTADVLVENIAKMGEIRDKGLGQHVRWVGETTKLVALAMGLGEVFSAELGLASRLHDFGKVAMPSEILFKRGPLSNDEWKVMRTHTTVGFQLLIENSLGQHSSLLRLAAQIALTHHESWNGSGYPLGLRAKQIPLAGRIVRVVDTFDALLSDRIYKSAWPIDQVIAYLSQYMAEYFDPKVVDVLLTLHKKNALPARY